LPHFAALELGFVLDDGIGAVVGSADGLDGGVVEVKEATAFDAGVLFGQFVFTVESILRYLPTDF
jgi:hypothetical protein